MEVKGRLCVLLLLAFLTGSIVVGIMLIYGINRPVPSSVTLVLTTPHGEPVNGAVLTVGLHENDKLRVKANDIAEALGTTGTDGTVEWDHPVTGKHKLYVHWEGNNQTFDIQVPAQSKAFQIPVVWNP